MMERPMTSEDVWERYEERKNMKSTPDERSCDDTLDVESSVLMIIAHELRRMNENLEKIAKRIQSDVI